ncbi:MAG: STAS domain-containing protein [Bacteroidia bacterium]|nr:STAS domain-containing protein [Bacteroidia bacterium]MDW8236039.1 STAS domain-containing protein [Bacteroidia bacterium]
MKYQIEDIPRGTIFRPLEERLNATHTAPLKSELTILAHSREGVIILDLSLVQSLDSSVLSALLLLRRILQGQGRPLIVVAPQPTVQSVFSLSKLNEIFLLMPTIEKALQYMEQQSEFLAKKARELEEEEEMEEEDWSEEDMEDWEDSEEDWEEEEDWDEEDWEEEDWEEEDWDEEDWEEEEEEEEEEE